MLVGLPQYAGSGKKIGGRCWLGSVDSMGWEADWLVPVTLGTSLVAEYDATVGGAD